MAYSYSRISTYLSCPFAYKKHYVDKISYASGEAANLGTYVHENIRAVLQGEETPFVNLQISSLKDAQRFFDNGNLVLGFLDSKFDIENIESEQDVWVDENFNLVDPNSEQGFLRGIIDLVIEEKNGNLIVLDWKTGRSEPDTLQLYIYAILTKAKYGKYPDEVGFIKLRTKEITISKIDTDIIDSVKKYLKELIKIIESDTEFKPKVGQHCSYCQVIHACPLAQDLNIPDLTTKEGIVEAMKKAHVLKQLASDIEKRVKNVIDTDEVVDADNYKVYYETTSYYSFKRKANASDVISEIINRTTEEELGKYLKINTNELINDERFEDLVKDYFVLKSKNTLKFESKN